MTTSHTPTPWDFCVSENSNFIHIETSLDANQNAGEQIATVNKGNKEQRLANAAFIVRAVNSHDALVEALEHYSRTALTKGEARMADEALALAKEGKS